MSVDRAGCDELVGRILSRLTGWYVPAELVTLQFERRDVRQQPELCRNLWWEALVGG